MEKPYDTGCIFRSIVTGADASHALLLFRKSLRRCSAGFCGIICMAVFSVSPGYADEPAYKDAKPGSQAAETGVAENLGIKPLGVLLTAAGTMLQFRYIVVDSKKSHPVFDRRNKTYLVDQASGAGFDMPPDTNLGSLRSSSRDQVTGKEYFIMFVNPGRLMKRGSKVSIVIGDHKLENLTVE
jgi:hypothetical protein